MKGIQKLALLAAKKAAEETYKSIMRLGYDETHIAADLNSFFGNQFWRSRDRGREGFLYTMYQAAIAGQTPAMDLTTVQNAVTALKTLCDNAGQNPNPNWLAYWKDTVVPNLTELFNQPTIRFSNGQRIVFSDSNAGQVAVVNK